LTNNAAAIQSAINDASTNGGGIVEIPADGTLSTYLSGPINLASGVNLQIDSGAMLQMLPRNVTTNGLTIIPNWPSASTPFISGSTLTDVAITGLGLLMDRARTGGSPRPQRARTSSNSLIVRVF